jgi:hypothetical protein
VLDLSSYSGIVVEADALPPGSTPLGLHLQLSQSGQSWDFSGAFALAQGPEEGGMSRTFIALDAFTRGSRSGFVCNPCTLDTSRINGMDVYVLFQVGHLHGILRTVM